MVEKLLDYFAQSGLTVEHVLLMVSLGLTFFLVISVYVSYPGITIFEIGYPYAFSARIVAHEHIGLTWTVMIIRYMFLLFKNAKNAKNGIQKIVCKILLKIPWY